jgi:uncharacterized protein
MRPAATLARMTDDHEAAAADVAPGAAVEAGAPKEAGAAAEAGAAEVVARLALVPHPEGGWYRETWRHEPPPGGGRPAGTAIYYLLAAGQRSHWHRVDATEIWHHYAGAPLRLSIQSGESQSGESPVTTVLLGPDLAAGQVPQAIVPESAWQAAEPTGAWTLVGCTVSPGFDFAGFELAPPGWSPDSPSLAPPGSSP